MPRKTPGPPCSVCSQPSVAKKLCDKHYRRWSKYGDVGATLRPDDWGVRTNHPLNSKWTQTKRNRLGRVSRWDDFYAFVADVGEMPGEDFILKRYDNNKPWGPANFFWHQKLQGRRYTLKTAEGRREYMKVWQANNRLKTKDSQLRRKYGISLEEYHEMLERQGGTCFICRDNDAAFKHLAVDHCHKTGRVRGLLCNRCNRAIGQFSDDPQRLSRAIMYLGGTLSP